MLNHSRIPNRFYFRRYQSDIFVSFLQQEQEVVEPPPPVDPNAAFDALVPQQQIPEEVRN